MKADTVSDFAAALAVARRAGIRTFSEFQALVMIARAGEPPTMGDISAALRVSSAVASNTVDRLERRGLVRRELRGGFADDRRIVRVHPTLTGSEIVRLLTA